MARAYQISMANSRCASTWKARMYTWEDLVDLLSDVRRTTETVADFDAMPKRERDKIKDGPAFVGGKLAGGKRRKGCVECRSLVVLDADNSDAELFGDWKMLVGCAAVLYPTHSSRAGALKHRLVIPLTRDVSADEYVPLAMRIAQTLGLARFDETTYQPERLMYLPSASSDADVHVDVCNGRPLDPDEWLATYGDWRCVEQWPVQPKGVERKAEKAPDPRNKKGPVGAFCRTYSIEDAIETYLPEIYCKAGRDGRYTFTDGSSVGGLVCYSHLWAYSNHATDPASGKLANAFDLVRIHRFGGLDEDAAEDAPITSLPSYNAMCEWVSRIDEVSVELARGAAQAAAEDFDAAPVDDSWMARLTKNMKTGLIESSASNILLILENDVRISGRLRRDVESGMLWAVGEKLPWREIPTGADLWGDTDDASLRIYLETRYGIVAKGKIEDAVAMTAAAAPYDPLRERLEHLPEWDGVERIDTLLIDALGAEDSYYVRQVTRKTLVGAIRRALRPGCKWDYMLILEGAQGLGKSSFWEMIAGARFFTDSLTLRDVENPKIAAEKMRGNWIVEVAELDGMAKASIERLKSFLTTKEDNFRAAYARHASVFKRRCIVVGTVNNLNGYLRDATGNRRFWPVRVSEKLDRALLTPDYIDQVWAEAKALDAAGETPYLDEVAEAQAREWQREAMEADPREGLVRAYLDTPLPADYAQMNADERDAFWTFSDERAEPNEDSWVRNEVSIIEIWHEALRQPKERPTRQDSYQIAAILTRLGWIPTGAAKRLKLYGVQKVYARGNKCNQVTK